MDFAVVNNNLIITAAKSYAYTIYKYHITRTIYTSIKIYNINRCYLIFFRRELLTFTVL